MTPAEVRNVGDSTVEVTRSFQAPVAMVWRAFTEPPLVRRWMLGPPGWTMPVCEMDVRVGGLYRWRWQKEQGEEEFGFHGEFREVVPSVRMVHTQIYDGGGDCPSMGDNGAMIFIDMTESGGRTIVTSAIQFATTADRDAALATGMTDGMEMGYQLLDKVLAE